MANDVLFNAGAGASTPSVTDSRGNTYTQAYWTGYGYLSGAGTGCYFAAGIKGGANTVTYAYHADRSINVDCAFEHFLFITEYSGLGGTVQGSNSVNIYGSAGNSPYPLSVTDSHGTSVTVTFGGTSGSGGPGTNGGWGIVDFVSGSTDYIVAGGISVDATANIASVSPIGYQAFLLRQQPSDTTNGWYGYFWDGGSGLVQRNNIDYDQVRSSVRQGTGGKFQMFGGAAPPVGGHLAIYDASGNVIDGGPGAVIFASETPAGTMNGTNTAFTLGNTPTAGSLVLFLNGVEQVPTTDYTISAATITYAIPPRAGDFMLAEYTH